MAYSLLFGERPTEAAAGIHPFRGVVAWFAGARARRAKRVALASLLELDPSLLADIGIERSDVVEALRRPHAAGQALAARRAKNASDWLAHP